MSSFIPELDRRRLGVCARGHDVHDVQPSLLVAAARFAATRTAGTSEEERLVTALHEAAHAVTAVAIGHEVLSATIKPTAASPYAAGSWGHVCTWRMPPPSPDDCWVRSHWVESYLMLQLAGYLTEDILFPDHADCASPAQVSDHYRAVHLLHAILPGDVERARATLVELRTRTFRLLELEQHIVILLQVAHLLLCEETVAGEEVLYRRLFKNRCNAIHPTDPSIRCTHPPHPYADHYLWNRKTRKIEERWPGFRIPNSRERVSALPPLVRRVRGLNAGGPGARLPKMWAEVFDACHELGISEEEWAISPLSRLRAALWVPASDTRVEPLNEHGISLRDD